MSSSIAKVIQIDPVSESAVVVSLKMPEEFCFSGGNWILLNTGITDISGKYVKRAFSIISSDRSGDIIRIAVRRMGETSASAFLNSGLQPGMELEYGGPHGKNFCIKNDDPAGELLFAATDTGITAIMGILNGRSADKYYGRARILYFREDGYDFLDDEFIKNNMPSEFHGVVRFVSIASPENSLRYRIIRENLLQEILEKTPDLAFLSGDGFALRIMREVLYLYGMDYEFIRSEPFFNSDMKKIIPKDPSELRTGYTTGACSAAAAKAAAKAVMSGKKIYRIESTLPNGDTVVFPVKKCEIFETKAVCSVIKDAGDDPDCTHLAELTAEVEITENPGISLCGGKGVATVTLPGLGLEIGGPSITENPRRNIIEMVASELKESGRGAKVTISVPDGEERSKKTTNARLGLVGGISILGISGIVRPYSTAAFRKSIIQAIEVAREKGAKELVFTTGGKTEHHAMKYLPHLEEESFIQVGDFIGTGVRTAVKSKMKCIHIYGMIGKLAKMADGKIQTHQKGSDVNMDMMAEIGNSLSLSADKINEIRKSTTGRNVLDIIRVSGYEKKFAEEICRRVVNNMMNYAMNVPVSDIKKNAELLCSGDFAIHCVMMDFDGKILGESSSGKNPD